MAQGYEKISMKNVDGVVENMHQLARDGNVDGMRKVLLKCANSPNRQKKLKKKDGEMFTPLHYAARFNHHSMCELLKDHKADVNCLGPDDMTPLHLVAKQRPQLVKQKSEEVGAENGSLEKPDEAAGGEEIRNKSVLEFLISAGADINKRDGYGLTSLHYASWSGNNLLVKRLLECTGKNKIELEAADKQGMTPLHFACKYGHTEVAKMLIEQQANIHCEDHYKGTPVLFAASGGHLKIIQILFEKCADEKKLLNEKNNHGNTALHLAIHKARIEVIQFLIEKCLTHDKDVLNAKRDNKDTPLHGAAKHGELEIVEMLLKNEDVDVDVNARNEYGQTPLLFAAQHNHHDTVKYLIEKNAVIDVRDCNNTTPLLKAASNGHVRTIELLLEKDANLKAVDKNDKSIIYICAEEKRLKALQTLLQNEKTKALLHVCDHYGNTPLHVAAINGRVDIVKVLLENGAMDLINTKNVEEQTPLHVAAINGSAAVVKEILKNKKSIIHDTDSNGNSSLHLAALKGKTPCVRVLLQYGAHTSARNIQQWTPLDCCAFTGMYKAAVVLLKNGAPVDAKDKKNQTPLHLACDKGHPDVVELLLNWKADITHRCSHKKNALDHAIDAGKVECVMAIIESKYWREAMRNMIKNGDTIETPMRKLIKKMPALACELFGKCMQTNGKGKEEDDYAIAFDYEFLDDENVCGDWEDVEEDEESDPNPGKTPQPSSNLLSCFKSDNSGNRENVSVVIEKDAKHTNGKGNPDRQKISPYSERKPILKNNHPLFLMVESKRENLLRHPLVVSLLNHKWRAYGRKFYYMNFLIYAFFMAMFNAYAMTLPPPFTVGFINRSTYPMCVVIQNSSQHIWGSECRSKSTWQITAGVFVILMSALGLLKEFYQMATQRLNYLKSFTNFIEIGAYLLSLLVVIDTTDYSAITGIREPWQWQCAGAAIFLSWMGLLLFLQNFPKLGIYVLMFTDITKSFLSFFFVFILFVIGFAFSFHVLLQNQVAFNFWWTSIVKTFAMMIGEFDFEGIFNSNDVHYPEMTYIIFVLFLIIMTIIIVNLLTGLAVDDIQQIQHSAVLQSLIMQVNLTLDIEYTVPHFLRDRHLKKDRNYKPNEFSKSDWWTKWCHSEVNLTQDDIDEVFSDQSALENMEEKLSEVQIKVRDLSKTFNDRTKNLEKMTKAIIKSLKIDFDDSSDDDDDDDDGEADVNNIDMVLDQPME